MPYKMIINAVDPEEIRIAIVNHKGILEDFDIETRGVEKNKGNIYKAVVTAVEPALNAAFVNYGADKEGFLTAGDVDPTVADKDPAKSYRITDLLKPKQEILVQVEKEEVGNKGAVLTTYLSLAGRYLVLMPGAQRLGVSRRIESEEERKKIRDAADKLNTPEGMGVIIRTAGKNRTKTDLNRDLKVLLTLWDNIQKEAKHAKQASLILKEQDVVIRSLRDYFAADIDEIIVDSDDAYDRAAEYMNLVMPKQKRALTRYVERRPILHHYKVEEQLDILFNSNVPLPSGGSIVIEPTEALVSIDVNSGKQKHKRQEETALKTNLEAANEAARQLRLRDLGGIIVVDFIDMVSRRNNQAVERKMKDALKVDKARVKVSRISANGTLELTRQRLSSALRVSVYRSCSLCGGTGHILNPESHALAVLRRLIDRAARGDLRAARVRIEPEAANTLLTEKWGKVSELEQRFNVEITITADRTMSPGQDDLSFEADPNAEVIEPPEPDFGPVDIPDDFYDDEYDDEEDEDEDDVQDEDAEGEAGDGKKRKKRRRGRRKKTGDRADEAASADGASADGKSGDILSLPSFELIDLDDYRKTRDGGRDGGRKKRGRGRGERGEGRGRGRGRGRDEAAEGAGDGEAVEGAAKKRRRRGGRRRGKGGAEGAGNAAAAGGGSAPKTKAAPAAAAGGGVGGFFRRLFGGKPKS